MNQKRVKVHVFGPTIFAYDGSVGIDGSALITNLDLVEEIKKGRRGFSPEIKFDYFECSICRQNYESCDHNEGTNYGETICTLIPRNVKFLGLSIVDKPKDPKCRINDMLIVDESTKPKTYTWYGFETDKEYRRFRHINDAQKQKLISDDIALFFVNRFTKNLNGTVTYPPL